LSLNNKNTFSDIFVTDDTNYLMAPISHEVIHHTAYITYTVNPRTGLQLYIGSDFRSSGIKEIPDEMFYMFGIRTTLINNRYDF